MYHEERELASMYLSNTCVWHRGRKCWAYVLGFRDNGHVVYCDLDDKEYSERYDPYMFDLSTLVMGYGFHQDELLYLERGPVRGIHQGHSERNTRAYRFSSSRTRKGTTLVARTVQFRRGMLEGFPLTGNEKIRKGQVKGKDTMLVGGRLALVTGGPVMFDLMCIGKFDGKQATVTHKNAKLYTTVLNNLLRHNGQEGINVI